MEQLEEEKSAARAHRGIDRVTKAAPSAKPFLATVAARNDNLGCVVSALLRILESTTAAELEAALAEALAKERVHVGAVRQILDRRRSARGAPPPVSIPVTRSEHANLVITPHALSTYDDIKKDDDS